MCQGVSSGWGPRRGSGVLASSPNTAQQRDPAQFAALPAGPQCPPSVSRKDGSGWISSGAESVSGESGRGQVCGRGWGGGRTFPCWTVGMLSHIYLFVFFLKKANLVNYNHKGLSALKC